MKSSLIDVRRSSRSSRLRRSRSPNPFFRSRSPKPDFRSRSLSPKPAFLSRSPKPPRSYHHNHHQNKYISYTYDASKKSKSIFHNFRFLQIKHLEINLNFFGWLYLYTNLVLWRNSFGNSFDVTFFVMTYLNTYIIHIIYSII